MTKVEFINEIAKNGNMTKRDAANALDSVVSTIMAVLDNKGSIKLAGFGTFSVKTTKARTYKNPKTGEPIDKPEKCSPTFKFSKTYKKAFEE